MEAFVINLLTHSRGLLAYVLIYGVLVACGLGVPLPEDISLVMGGFLSHLGVTRLPIMIAVGFFGILTGDTLIYSAGRRLGSLANQGGSGFFARVVTPEKRAKVEKLFAIHGQKIVMIARFLPGIRAVAYFTAGSAGMRYWAFIFWDGLAALVSAPLFVYLGCRFGGHLRNLKDRIHQGQKVVIIVLLVGAALYMLYRRHRSLRIRASDAAQRAGTQPPSDRPPSPPGSSPAPTPQADPPGRKPGLGSERARVSAHPAK